MRPAQPPGPAAGPSPSPSPHRFRLIHPSANIPDPFGPCSQLERVPLSGGKFAKEQGKKSLIYFTEQAPGGGRTEQGDQGKGDCSQAGRSGLGRWVAVEAGEERSHPG